MGLQFEYAVLIALVAPVIGIIIFILSRPAYKQTAKQVVIRKPGHRLLGWFIPWPNDEYTQIVRIVGPEFVKSFKERKRKPEETYLNQATIYTTGHSFGGRPDRYQTWQQVLGYPLG